MSFELPDGATVAKAWNGTLDQDGSVCTVCNPRFCKPVDRGQAVLYPSAVLQLACQRGPGP
jgi:hypothetical protein